MKAMILAAGRGERMRPLTDSTPKPLIQAGDYRLIEYHIMALEKAGIEEIIINTAWLGEQICTFLGNGSQYNVYISYSHETNKPQETAGGIIQALPLLGLEPFILINADIWTDYDFTQLIRPIQGLAHLVMVPNPEHNTDGDFGLDNERIQLKSAERLTYSGIGLYDPELFSDLTPGKRPLLPVLEHAIEANEVTGEQYHGKWMDIGTEERLNTLKTMLLTK